MFSLKCLFILGSNNLQMRCIKNVCISKIQVMISLVCLQVIFITEYMSSGSLKQFLKRTKRNVKKLPLQAWKRWCSQILSALRYVWNQSSVNYFLIYNISNFKSVQTFICNFYCSPATTNNVSTFEQVSQLLWPLSKFF